MSSQPTSANIAFVFPGQGSQKVGMGRTWHDAGGIGREMFERADDALGRPLSQICFEGPEEELKKTANAQPALYVCGAIVCEALRQRGITPTLTAGHSLGEYTALFAAGAFDFETGLRLVRRRGELMNEASEARPGAMAAVLGLDVDALNKICAEAGGVCTVANINAPGQVVISGAIDAVERASEAAKAAGARRAMRLPVHGAFHSPLMADAAEKMAEALAAAELNAPALKCLCNVDAEFVATPDAVRDALSRQIMGAVRWVEIMGKIVAEAPAAIVEAGTGNVLTGLFKRLKPPMPLLNCDTAADLDAVAAALQNLNA